jgi:anion-transporting  ArsA/GET3 family ATPase
MSLKQVFEEHPERRYIMFGGKGGLGKTTFSAATAYWLAKQGKRVLVFSVDPQASLSDIFQKDIFGKGAVKIMDNLWAQEVDADSHIKAYQDQIRKKILDRYGFDAVPEEIEQYEILSELQYIRGRINASSQILTDKEKTAFFFVVIPEEMILIDTRKAAELFAKFDVPLSGYVVNRVLPKELLQQNVPAYLKNRIVMQDKYLDEIETMLGSQVAARVPELERDVTGLDMIRRLSEIMYGR